MKKLSVFLVLALFFFMPITVSAKSADEYLSDFGSLVPEEIDESVKDGNALTNSLSFKNMLFKIYEIISQNGGELIAFLLTLISLSFFVALAETYQGALSQTVRGGVSAIAGVMIFKSIFSLVFSVSNALSEISSFFEKIIPVFTGITVAGGGVNTATISSLGMSITLGVVGGFSSEFLGSLVLLLFALGLVSNSDEASFGLTKSAKGAFTSFIGIATFLIGSTLALQTTISGAQDSMLMRSAKFAVSGSIPIVGGTVSGAISTLASGLSYAKSFIGVGSVAVIITLALVPAVLLLAYRFILSLAVAFLSFLGAGGGARPFSSMLSALDSLIAVFILSTLIYIFEIILFVKSGVALI